jgi:hypothetical protein
MEITRIKGKIYVQYSQLKLSESHEHPKYSQKKAIGEFTFSNAISY